MSTLGQILILETIEFISRAPSKNTKCTLLLLSHGFKERQIAIVAHWHNLHSSPSAMQVWSLEISLSSNFTIVTPARGLFSHFAGPETTLTGHHQTWRVQSLLLSVYIVSSRKVWFKLSTGLLS